MKDKVSIKKAVLAECQAKVAESIASTTALLNHSIASMHGETKSSAGDKFETSRAMLQAEQDRLKTILIKSKELEHQLARLPMEIHDEVRPGCIVVSETATYFLAVGLGKIKAEEKVYYVISQASPIGRLLVGKQKGESIIFNGKTTTITDVF